MPQQTGRLSHCSGSIPVVSMETKPNVVNKPGMATYSTDSKDVILHLKDSLSPKQCSKCSSKLSDGDILCQCRECPQLTLCQQCEQSVLLDHFVSQPHHVFLKMIVTSPGLSDVISLPISDRNRQSQNADQADNHSDLGSEWSDCLVDASPAQIVDTTGHTGFNLPEGSGWFESVDWVKNWSATGQVSVVDKPSQAQLPVNQPSHDDTDSESFSIIDPADIMNVLSLSDTSDEEDGDLKGYSPLKQSPVSVKTADIPTKTDTIDTPISHENTTPTGSPLLDIGLNSLSNHKPVDQPTPCGSDTIEDLAELTIHTVQNAGAAFMNRFHQLLDNLDKGYSPPTLAYKPPESKYVPPTNTFVPQTSYVPQANAYIPRQNTYIPRQTTDTIVHRHLKGLDTPWLPKQKYVPKV